jgi:siroheme synthase-like protein
MIFLPVSLNITDKKLLLVGGGSVAVEKINSLKRFTDLITVIAREVRGEISAQKYTVLIKSYEKNDLEGFFLVYACTNDRALNQQIKRDCEEKKILVNIADNPDAGGFVSPAVYKMENMTVSVGSNGEDVRKSIEWRNKIKLFLESNETFNI